MTRIIHLPTVNQKNYNERVNRTEVFLGIDRQEREKSQEILSRCTVGIAGTGGIGGAMALRLARFGIKKLKIADPEDFDWSNINRQLGATKNNVGKNKAEIVGDMVNELAGDVEIEIFTDGITVENADEFVAGCDIVLDQLEFMVIKEKFALHRAFRANKNVKNILACTIVGYGAYLYKYTHDSMSVEEWYDGIDENQELDEETVERLIGLWAPKFAHFPSYGEVRNWMKENDAVPIFAGTPPLAEGLLTQRTILCLLNQEHPPYAQWLPPIPQMYVYDAATFVGEMVTSDGKIKNLEELEITWNAYNRRG